MATQTFEQVRTMLKSLSLQEKRCVFEELARELAPDRSEQPPKPFRSIRGILANTGPVPSLEDIAEMRREAWANFPREEFYE